MTIVSYDNLNQLVIYRNILQDEIISSLYTACQQQETFSSSGMVCHHLIQKAERLGLSGDVIKNYILYVISKDQNTFSIIAEKNHGQIGSSLQQAVINDIKIIKQFLANDFSSLLKTTLLQAYNPTAMHIKPRLEELASYFDANTPFEPEKIIKYLTQQYLQYGYGAMADFSAFRYHNEDGLTGIVGNDPIKLDDIIGYEKQKNMLIKNTEAFLQNKPCNNILLTGARGTGKSSSVKALVNQYCEAGLRLVEIPKYELKNLYKAITLLQSFGKKFILFLDDLSFEEFESDYKCLKSVLEGGIEAKPANVLIYATSNRRHLIRENWQDRNEQDNDMHHTDTVNEKISLADRFGITLTYFTPSQEEYFKIVEEIAARQKLGLNTNQLKEEALKWEMSHSGRSGRAAQQLVSHLLGA